MRETSSYLLSGMGEGCSEKKIILSQEGLGALVHSKSDRLQGPGQALGMRSWDLRHPWGHSTPKVSLSQVMLLSQTSGAWTTSLPILSEMLCGTVTPQKDKQASGDRSPHKHPTLWSQTLWIQGCRGGQRSFIQVPVRLSPAPSGDSDSRLEYETPPFL